ncbi:MAG: PH domain-containing protein [Actinomycetota bacterium]
MSMITPGAPRRNPLRLLRRRLSWRPRRSSSRSVLSPAGVRIVQRYLLSTERPVIATRRHWVVIVEPVGVAVLAVFFCILVITGVGDRLSLFADLVIWAALIVIVRMIWSVIEWRRDWFVVTDERLLLTAGLISRKVAIMPLAKVTDMSYNVSVWGRLLRYGEFIFESAGQDQALRSIAFMPNSHGMFAALSEELFGEYGIASTKRMRPAAKEDDGTGT